MQNTNPFDLILSRLDQLQSTINVLSSTAQKQTSSPPTPDKDRLLDLAEAAEVVRKPIGTVRHYIHHRNLPAIKIGKSYLIKLDELLVWVNGFQDKKEPEETSMDKMLANRKRYAKYTPNLSPDKY